MAQVKGKAGRYVAQRLSMTLMLGIIGVYFATLLIAFLIGMFLANRTWPALLALVACEALLVLVGRHFLRKAQKEISDWSRGLDGEIIVGKSLVEDLPDTFRVIHDLNTQFGNLDHIVVGPTGVFAVETKNWRGAVTSDGHGELLWNGHPTDKPFVKNFTRTIMAIRERWAPLARSDRFIQGVMVFPSAYEDAKWGTTGNVHCISKDSIPTYFVNHRSTKDGKLLSEREVDEIARAFLALARMDEGFETDE